MDKKDQAGYLVSLHTLIEAQSKGQHSLASQTLAEEYERAWGEFKETLRKEQEDAKQKS